MRIEHMNLISSSKLALDVVSIWPEVCRACVGNDRVKMIARFLQADAVTVENMVDKLLLIGAVDVNGTVDERVLIWARNVAGKTLGLERKQQEGGESDGPGHDDTH